ncbi:MAG: hypothetical protein DWQ08_15645 [Proteobacteria bacterium]|nr:MAG: hypothetical protein DWQ08_15645 [Pseudomonadota bacterium]
MSVPDNGSRHQCCAAPLLRCKIIQFAPGCQRIRPHAVPVFSLCRRRSRRYNFNMLNSFGKAVTGSLLNAVALGAIGWVAWDTWNRGVFQGVGLSPAEVTVERLDAPRSRVDVNAIVRAHLFGREQREQAPVTQKVAPPTRLNLKLVGVISQGNDTRGIALIETGRGRQQVVRVGESIGKTGARLAEVAHDHVLIERNGRLEKLAIKRPELDADSFQPLELRPGGATAANGRNADNPSLPAPGRESYSPRELQPAAAAPASGGALPGSAVADGAGPPQEDASSPPPAGGRRLTLPF